MPETPMMTQYYRVKEKHKEEILFFRMGDFYEMFLEDAEIASNALGLAITARNKSPEAVPMAGIPAKAIDSYLPKLLQKGFKVAICEQLEDPAQAQGLVERDVVRIITPGTITEENVLSEKINNFLLSICPDSKKYGLAWVDISTGQFIVHEIVPESVRDEIARIAPAECLVPENASECAIQFSDGTASLESTIQLYNIAITHRPVWFFEAENGRHILLEHFHVQTLDGYGCERMREGLGAAGALLKYVAETQKCNIGNLDKIEVYNAGETMFLDRATRYCLEIQKTMREENKQGTLLSVMDQTCTAMGGRLLASWISCPLTVPEKIRARQEGVDDFVSRPEILNKTRDTLSDVQDIERLCSKIAYERANARDLLALKTSIQTVPILYEILQNCNSLIIKELRKDLTAVDDVANLLERGIHPEPPQTIKDGYIIKDGYNADLDELRNIQQSGDNWLKQFEERETQRTNIPSLKVGYTKVFGYYIEVTHTHSHKIPSDYIRKQTLKNAERYITPELKEYEGKVLSASDRSKALEYDLFLQIRNEVAKALPRLRKVAGAIASIDTLCSLGKLARERHYVCPVIDTSKDIVIVNGRHPVLEITRAGTFVPNDIKIGPGREIGIITGPNMAGKSTYIRQSALIILMAQTGSFVPASQARIGIVDRIFTRIGSADEIARGRSTFMVEMLETANILNNATEKSFIALDEIGRGTSTFDGISLAWAIIEYIQNKTNARTMFATHYHEITDLSGVYPNVVNYNVAVQEWGEEIAFLYKIVEGSADKSYGIHVARLAGIPKAVLKRARTILGNLESHAIDLQNYTRQCCKISNGKPPGREENLFSLVGEEIIDTLAHLDINNLTPLEAMDILKELQNEAKKI